MLKFDYGAYIGKFGCIVIILTVVLVEIIKKNFLKDSKVKALCPYIAGAISCILFAIYGVVTKLPFLPLFGRALLCAVIAILCYDLIINLVKSIDWVKLINKLLENFINLFVNPFKKLFSKKKK